MSTLYLISVWLHLLAATTWIGGMIFFVAIVIPVLKGKQGTTLFPSEFYNTILRFRTVGWIALSTLLLTGAFNMYFRGFRLGNVFEPTLWHGASGQALLYKIILFGILIAISFVHDFFLGPKAIEIQKSEPGSPLDVRLRFQTRWLGRLTFLLSLVILVLAVLVVRGSLLGL